MRFDVSTTAPNDIYNLLIGLVAPRPIAWITSMDKKGNLNAAPFSAYNYLCTDPPIVGIGVTNRPDQPLVGKDTARNIRATGEFVVNVVTEDLSEQMNICAIDFPAGVDELKQAKLTTAKSMKVNVPRIAQAHAALECREFSSTEIGKSRIILGQVVAFYIEDQFVDPTGPYIKADALHAIGRMNGQGAYVKTRGSMFQMPRIKLDDWTK